MDTDSLKVQLDVVFNKEESDQKNEIETWSLIKDHKGNFNLDYPHSNTLIDIFSNIQNNEKNKKFFIQYLIQNLSNKSDNEFSSDAYTYVYYGNSHLSFFTLLRLGYVDKALEALTRRTVSYPVYIYTYTLYDILIDLIKAKYNFFNLEQLLLLRKTLGGLNGKTDTKDTCINHLDTMGYENLKLEIKGINLEINQDKKELINKINYLNFDEKYEELLRDIDNYIHGDTPRIVSSGMISNLRAFLELLVKDLSKRISKESNEEIPKDPNIGEMGNIWKYLKPKLELSDNDKEFIKSFIAILHKEGGHAFISEKEYFRLSRNIAIEIALFLISKYEKLKNENQGKITEQK